MKQKIHPQTQAVTVICSCGTKFEVTAATKEKEMRVEICSSCHPFYTGEQRILKTGAVDKFYARQKKSEEKQKDAEEKKPAAKKKK